MNKVTSIMLGMILIVSLVFNYFLFRDYKSPIPETFFKQPINVLATRPYLLGKEVVYRGFLKYCFQSKIKVNIDSIETEIVKEEIDISSNNDN